MSDEIGIPCGNYACKHGCDCPAPQGDAVEAFEWLVINYMKPADVNLVTTRNCNIVRRALQQQTVDVEECVSYISRHSALAGNCRDCADECGTCPHSKIACGYTQEVVRNVLNALQYGLKHGFIKTYPCTPLEKDEDGPSLTDVLEPMLGKEE